MFGFLKPNRLSAFLVAAFLFTIFAKQSSADVLAEFLFWDSMGNAVGQAVRAHDEYRAERSRQQIVQVTQEKLRRHKNRPRSIRSKRLQAVNNLLDLHVRQKPFGKRSQNIREKKPSILSIMTKSGLITQCPLLAISGHNLNAARRLPSPLTLCPLLTQSGHKVNG